MKKKKPNKSRFVLLIIFIGTLSLSGLAVFLGIRLQTQEQVAPEESSATINEGLLGDVHTGSSYSICSSNFLVENLAENFNSETGTYTITGNYRNNESGNVSGNAAVFVCRCKEGDGNNDAGHCNGNWPANDGPDYNDPGLTPLTAAQTCEQLSNIDLNLAPGETRDINIVAQQASPAACGSFQIDVLAVRPDGEGEDPGAQLTLPGSYSCEWQDWYHLSAVYRTGVDCVPSCESLTADGASSIEITKGEAASAALEAVVDDFGIASTTYEVTSGFGNVSGSTWSLSAGQSADLSAGDTGTIQLLLDGNPENACVVNLSVTEEAVTPVCGGTCSVNPDSSTGFKCVSNQYVKTDYQTTDCDIDEYVNNSCACPAVTPTLSCDSLAVQGGQTTVSYTGETVSLTSEITAASVSGDVTYTYGTDTGTVTGSGSTATWEIPTITSGATEVSAWVGVAATGVSAGCSDASCTNSCIVTLQVTSPDCGDGTCNSGETCEIVGDTEYVCDGSSLGDTLPSGSCRTTNCTYCGDGIVNSGEECEPGDVNSDTAQTCNTSCQWGPAPQCGSTCTTDEQCPSGMSCTTEGICRDTLCPEDTDCVCDVAPPQCGDACTTSSDCPTGMTCTSDNICRRTECTDAVDCICTGIIGSDLNTKIITGILLIILGVVVYKMSRSSGLLHTAGVSSEQSKKSDESLPIMRTINRSKKKRKDKFEKKFEKKS